MWWTTPIRKPSLYITLNWVPFASIDLTSPNRSVRHIRFYVRFCLFKITVFDFSLHRWRSPQSYNWFYLVSIRCNTFILRIWHVGFIYGINVTAICIIIPRCAYFITISTGQFSVTALRLSLVIGVYIDAVFMPQIVLSLEKASKINKHSNVWQ
jgi:hypothetical protein